MKKAVEIKNYKNMYLFTKYVKICIENKIIWKINLSLFKLEWFKSNTFFIKLKISYSNKNMCVYNKIGSL